MASTQEAAAQYDTTAAGLAKAIHKRFFVANISGYIDTRQTHLVMALVSGAVPAQYTDAVWAALRKEITQTQASARCPKWGEEKAWMGDLCTWVHVFVRLLTWSRSPV